MTAYYNEIDPYVAQWLRNLISEELIPAGHVDDRSIVDVRPSDLAGYTQAHFFAGLGGWARALRLVGWGDDHPVWTGSCPCQPFSIAGQRRGFEDDRHLWPEWFRLIRECRPPVVFGEQVARAAEWLALVRGDLEAVDYAMGAIPIEAASVGANHKRDRIWFVAHPYSEPIRLLPGRGSGAGWSCAAVSGDDGEAGLMANANGNGWSQGRGDLPTVGHGRSLAASRHDVADARCEPAQVPPSRQFATIEIAQRGSWWEVEPDVGRVADGVSARVAKLRALGNAIVPQVAAEFIRAAMIRRQRGEQ